MTTSQLASFETITWADHAIKSFKHLHEFYCNQALCDVTLIAQDGTTFKAHQILLAVHSSFFHWVFHGWRVTGERVTEFKTDIEAEVLEALLCLVYQGEVKVSVQGPWRQKILEVASTLQFTGVVEVLAGTLGVGVTTVGGVTKSEEGRTSGGDEGGKSSVNEEPSSCSLNEEVRPCSLNEEVRPCSLNEEGRPLTLNEGVQPCSVNEEVRPCSVSGELGSCSLNDEHCPVKERDGPLNEEKTVYQNYEPRSGIDSVVRSSVNEEVLPCMNEEVGSYPMNEAERAVYSNEEVRTGSTEEGRSHENEDRRCDQNEILVSQNEHLDRQKAEIAIFIQNELMKSQVQGGNSTEVKKESPFSHLNQQGQPHGTCTESSTLPLVHDGCSQTGDTDTSLIDQSTSVSDLASQTANTILQRLPSQRFSGSAPADVEQEIPQSSGPNFSDHQLKSLIEVHSKNSSISSDVNSLNGVDETCYMPNKKFPLSKVSTSPRSRKGVKKEKSTEGSLKCTECASMYSLRKTLKFHLMQVHRLTAEQVNCNPELLIKCEVENCHFASINYVEVERHAKANHPSVKHRCLHCVRPRTFHLAAMLERHQRKVHGAQDIHRCLQCGQSFSKLVYLQEHERDAHGVQHSIKLFRCEIEGCKYKTVRMALLQKHQKVGHCQHKCPHCNIVVKTNNTLQTHIRTMHLNIRPFLCDVCGAGFSKEPILRQHVKTKHSDIKEYMCQLCPYATNIHWYLANHVFHRHGIRAHFDNRKELKCPDCSLKFLTKSYLQKHIRNVHDDTFKWTCDVCGKTYKSLSAMSTHRKIHQDSESKCPYCEYSSKTGEHMKLHIRTLHTFKGMKPYICPYCSYSSAIGGNVRKHVMQKHPGEEVRYDTNKEQILHMQIAEAQMERGGKSIEVNSKSNTMMMLK